MQTGQQVFCCPVLLVPKLNSDNGKNCRFRAPPHRQHPDGGAHPPRPRSRGRGPYRGQSRIVQSGRKRQGPDCPGHGRAGRSPRHAPPRRYDHRTHERKYRRGAGAGQRPEGLSADPDHARDDEHRAAPPGGRLRSQGGPHARRRRDEGDHCKGRGPAPGDSRSRDPWTVQQSGQPRAALPHDGRRDMARHRRTGRLACGRRRHGRHALRHRAPAARAESANRPCGRRTGLVPRALGRQARCPQDPGHRRRLHPRKLRCRTGRPGGDHHRRAGHRHGASAGRTRRAAGRHFVGRCGLRRPATGPGAPQPRQNDRRRAGGHRRALPFDTLYAFDTYKTDLPL